MMLVGFSRIKYFSKNNSNKIILIIREKILNFNENDDGVGLGVDNYSASVEDSSSTMNIGVGNSYYNKRS